MPLPVSLTFSRIYVCFQRSGKKKLKCGKLKLNRLKNIEEKKGRNKTYIGIQKKKKTMEKNYKKTKILCKQCSTYSVSFSSL